MARVTPNLGIKLDALGKSGLDSLMKEAMSKIGAALNINLPVRTEGMFALKTSFVQDVALINAKTGLNLVPNTLGVQGFLNSIQKVAMAVDTYTAAASATPLSIGGTNGTAAGVVGTGFTFAPILAGGSGSYGLSISPLSPGPLAPGRALSGLTVGGSYTKVGVYTYILRLTDLVTNAFVDSIPIVVTVTSTVAYSIAINPASQAEGNAGTTKNIVVTATRSGDISDVGSAQWARTGTMDAADFAANTPSSGTFNFAAGVSTATLTQVVQGDNAYEADETAIYTLSNVAVLPNVTATIPVPSATAIITNDDVAPAPVLALTGSLTFATNTTAGTTVANIANVPSGVTPTLTPNDGRLVIAGDATNGWKVVVGLSASTAGPIAVAVAAAGATGASATVIVTAATPLSVVPAPASPYNGTAGSGFGGSPPTPSGTATLGYTGVGVMPSNAAATANGSWLYTEDFLPECAFLDGKDKTMIVRTDYEPGTQATINIEGSTITATSRVAVQIDVCLAPGVFGKRTVYQFAFLLRAADFTTYGALDCYATIHSGQSGVADRVIGPLRMYRRADYTKRILFGPSLANAPASGTATTWLQAYTYAAQQTDGGNYALICNEDQTVDTSNWPSGPQSASAAYNTRRGTIDIFANGKALTYSRSSTSFKADVRPFFNGVIFHGGKFDFANWQFYLELVQGNTGASNVAKPTFVGCEMYSSNGVTELPLGALRPNMWLENCRQIACYVHDIAEGDLHCEQIGNFRTDRVGDCCQFVQSTGLGVYPGLNVCYNTFQRALYAIPFTLSPGFSFSYSGTGTPTYRETGTRNTISHVLTLYVNGGTAVGTYTPTAFGGSMFNYSQLVAQINSDLGSSGWTATWISDRGNFSTFVPTSAPEVPASATNYPVSTDVNNPTVISSKFFVHQDGVQLSSYVDNFYYFGNVLLNNNIQTLFYGTTSNSIFSQNVSSMALFDTSGNGSGDTSGTAIVTQFGGAQINTQMDHNSFPNQKIEVQVGATYDAYSSIRNNIGLLVHKNSTSVTSPARCSGNVEFTAANPSTPELTGTVNLSPATPLGSYPDLDKVTTARSFIPAAGSAIRTNSYVPTVPYDIFGNLRAANDLAGAVAAAAS